MKHLYKWLISLTFLLISCPLYNPFGDTTYNFSDSSTAAYLKAPNNSDFDFFGASIDVSGNTVVVGSKYECSSTSSIIHGSDLSSTNDDGSSNGAVYVFTFSGSNWSHQAYLKAPNTSVGDYFGYSVAIDGDTIVVGAPEENGNTNTIINGSDISSANSSGSYNGAAYVFRLSGDVWSLEAYLKAPNTSNLDHFGSIVAVDGDTIAVGSTAEASTTNTIINGSDLSSTNDSGNDQGAVYIFKRTGSTWIHEAYLKAPNTTSADNFGLAISIDNDTVAVGTPDEGSTTTGIIHGSDLSSTNNDGDDNGAVYIFKRTGSTWIHEAYLKIPYNDSGDNFGCSVSIEGDNLVAGSTGEDSTTTAIINGNDLSDINNDGSNNGAAYYFQRHFGTTWQLEAYLKAPNTSSGDWFGNSVAIRGETIIVGAYNEASSTDNIIYGSDLSETNNNGSQNGAVYIFKREMPYWSHYAYLKAPNTTVDDHFGNSIALNDTSIVVAALQEDSTTTSIIKGLDLSKSNNDGDNNGAVYIFDNQN